MKQVSDARYPTLLEGFGSLAPETLDLGDVDGGETAQ